jgi:hypothetical protein
LGLAVNGLRLRDLGIGVSELARSEIDRPYPAQLPPYPANGPTNCRPILPTAALRVRVAIRLVWGLGVRTLPAAKLIEVAERYVPGVNVSPAFGFWVLGFGFWVLGSRFWVRGFGFWV